MVVRLTAIRAIRFRLWRPAPRRSCSTRGSATGTIDPLLASELQQFHVEGPEPNAVVEVAQVREFVAQGAHQAGIKQRLAGDGVAKPDLDHAIFVTDAVAALYIGALGLDRPVTEAEPPGDLLCVSIEARDQAARCCAIHPAFAIFHVAKLSVGSGQRQENRPT